jgi:hypothetical protein
VLALELAMDTRPVGLDQTLLPILYLRGVSTADFREALSALLGKDAPSGRARMSDGGRQADYDARQERNLSSRCYKEGIRRIAGLVAALAAPEYFARWGRKFLFFAARKVFTFSRQVLEQ